MEALAPVVAEVGRVGEEATGTLDVSLEHIDVPASRCPTAEKGGESKPEGDSPPDGEILQKRDDHLLEIPPLYVGHVP